MTTITGARTRAGDGTPGGADAGGRASWRGRAATVILAVIVCTAGVAHAFRPTLASGFARMQADPLDTRFNHYVLEHGFRWAFARDYPFPLWSPPMFYPARATLAYSDNLLGAAPIYWLARLAAPPDTAYSLWMIACSALNFAAMLWVLRRLEVHPLLALAGAFWFAFGLPRTLLINHQQLLPHFYSPPAVYFAMRFLAEPTTRRLAMVVTLACMQLWAGVYLGWFLVLSLSILFAVALVFNRGARRRVTSYVVRHKPATLAIALACAAMLAPLARPYLRAQREIGARSFEEVEPYLPPLRSWLPAHASPAWQRALDAVSAPLPPGTENMRFFQGYAFAAAILLAAWLLVLRRRWLDEPRRSFAVVCLVTGLLLLVVSLRFESGLTLWRLVHEFVPGAGAIRAVGRIHLVIYLYLTLGGMICVNAIVRRLATTGRRRTVVLGVALLIAMGEQLAGTGALPSFEVSPYRDRIAQLGELMRGSDAAFVSVHRRMEPMDFAALQIDAMWAGLEAGVPVVNGYSGAVPPGYRGSWNPQGLRQWIAPREPRRLTIIGWADPGLPPAWSDARPGETSEARTRDFVALTVAR